MIYNFMSPDTTVKTAALVATKTSNILNRTITLVNFVYGEDFDQGTYFADQGTILVDQEEGKPCFADEGLQEEYIIKETKRERAYLI